MWVVTGSCNGTLASSGTFLSPSVSNNRLRARDVTRLSPDKLAKRFHFVINYTRLASHLERMYRLVATLLMTDPFVSTVARLFTIRARLKSLNQQFWLVVSLPLPEIPLKKGHEYKSTKKERFF